MNICTFVAILSRNPQYDFPKIRGGGSKAVWNFSEVSSALVTPSVPYLLVRWVRGVGLSASVQKARRTKSRLLTRGPKVRAPRLQVKYIVSNQVKLKA